jgi:GTP-binding protein EngB required for normal cell division
MQLLQNIKILQQNLFLGQIWFYLLLLLKDLFQVFFFFIKKRFINKILKKESEKQFLSSIKQWGKKVIIIINKFDLIKNEEDKKIILKFVSEGITKLLGI